MIKPNFFLVGAPKCGTTALYTYLKDHPEIFMSSRKETQFFAADVLGEHRAVRTWPEYLSFFAAAEAKKRIGEASASYLGSDLAAHEIKAFSTDAKIIIMLRNPIDWMYAFYGQRFNDGTERFDTFEKAIDADEKRERGLFLKHIKWPPGLGYRRGARFAHHVRRYFNIFGRENVHVIIHDDFKRDTATVYQLTLDFLGVSRDSRPYFPVIFANRRLRSRSVKDFLQRPSPFLQKLSHATVPRQVRQFLRKRISTLNLVIEPRSPLREDLRTRLEKEFESEVEELSTLLNRNLTFWSNHRSVVTESWPDHGAE